MPTLADTWTTSSSIANSGCAGLLDLPGHGGRCGQVGRAAGQDRELIPAEPGDRCRSPAARHEPLADLLEQEVAVVVPERVIDLLEPVEIHHQHRPRLVVALGRRERLKHVLAEQGAVRQPGQRVMQRLMLETLGVRLALGDVTHERQRETVDRRACISPCSTSIANVEPSLRQPSVSTGPDAECRARAAARAGPCRKPRNSSWRSGAMSSVSGCPIASCSRVAEQRSRRRVERLDQPVLAGGDDPVRHVVEHRLRARLAVAQRGVQRRDRIERTLQLLGLHEQVDEHRDLGPQHVGHHRREDEVDRATRIGRNCLGSSSRPNAVTKMIGVRLRLVRAGGSDRPSHTRP